MANFNLSLGDYVALAGLMLTTVAAQYFTASAQIEASEARTTGEIKLLEQRLDGANDVLLKKLEEMSTELKTIVAEGLSDRNDEVMVALSSWVGPEAAFTIKVANIPTESNLYRHFVELASTDGITASVYALNTSAIGTVRVNNYDDAEAEKLTALFAEAKAPQYNDLKVRFEFDMDGATLTRERQVKIMNGRIDELQRRIQDLTEP